MTTRKLKNSNFSREKPPRACLPIMANVYPLTSRHVKGDFARKG